MPVKQDSAAKTLLNTLVLPAYVREGKAYIIAFNKGLNCQLLVPTTFTEARGITGRLIIRHREQDEAGQDTDVWCFTDLLTGRQITKSTNASGGWERSTRLLTTHTADFEAFPAINSLAFQQILVAEHSKVAGLYSTSPFMYEVIKAAIELGQPLLTIKKQ